MSAAAPAAVGSCQACNMRFASIDEMRQHYTTDFHIANVRARVEGEAKVSAAEYRRRTMVDDDKKPIFSCKLCSKKFHSVQTLQSHVKSTEHLMRKEQRIIERDGSVAGSALSTTSLGSAALGLHRRHRAHLRARTKQSADTDRTLSQAEAEEAAEAAAALGKKIKRAVATSSAAAADAAAASTKVPVDDREADVTEARCLFCGLANKTMKRNLKHMLIAHDFEIPLEHRCHDPRGLLQYLARKINGLMCLVCGEGTKRFESLEALRAHMAAADHDRVPLTSEYNSFYEGTLDNGDAVPVPGLLDGGGAALVIRAGPTAGSTTTKRIYRKDNMLPIANRRIAESSEQLVQRRLLTAQGARDTQILLREHRKETQKERTKHFKEVNHFYRYQKLHALRCGIKKLWKKGFDGDGVEQS